MTAELIILPVLRRFSHTLDALEQRDREVTATIATHTAAPPRSRPLLVINNKSASAPARLPADVGSALRASGGGATGHVRRKPGSGAGVRSPRITEHARWDSHGDLA